jgi:hypothetical protein
MARRVAYLTFQPSTYSTGLAFPDAGLPAQEEYGFLPLIAAWFLKEKMEEKAAESITLVMLKKYWWVGLLIVPVAYIAIDKGLDAAAKKRAAR